MTTGRRGGHPVRVLKNPFAREYYKKEFDSNVTDEELDAFGRGSLPKARLTVMCRAVPSGVGKLPV